MGRVVSGIAHELERQLTLVGYAEIFRARPLVSLHRKKFAQVVMNLVSNAVLATAPGDTVWVSVDMTWRDETALATLVVRDTGAGMSRDVLAQLGRPFLTTRAERGSGLGVGICMRIVEEHGGVLSYESKQGSRRWWTTRCASSSVRRSPTRSSAVTARPQRRPSCSASAGRPSTTRSASTGWGRRPPWRFTPSRVGELEPGDIKPINLDGVDMIVYRVGAVSAATYWRMKCTLVVASLGVHWA